MKKILLFLLLMVVLTACSASGAPTYRYSDVVQTVRGDAVSAASATVYLANTVTKATLYSGTTDASAALTNPVYSDSYGRFYFYAIPGTYDIVISGSNVTSHTTEDVVVAPSFYDEFNVKAYGAKGDGVTDDTAAIQAAIDACNAAGGGRVYFPEGKYLSTGFNLDGMVGVSLCGASQYGTILLFDNTDGTWISLSSSNMCNIFDFEIESSGSQKTAGNNIWYLGASNCSLVRVRMLSAYNGIIVDQSDQITIRKFVHRNQNVLWDINKIIGIVQSAGTHIEDVNLGWGLATILTSAIDVNSGCDTTKFVNVEAVQVGGNTTNKPVLKIHHFLVGSSFAPRWLRFTNCAFESGTSGQGILIEDCDDVVFSGLYSVTNGTGVVIQDGRLIRFYGGVVGNNQYHGVDIQGGDDIQFVGITSTGNSQDTTSTYSDFVISTATSNDVKFIDCSAGPDASVLFGATIAEKSLYGFNVISSASGNGHEIIRPVIGPSANSGYSTTASDIFWKSNDLNGSGSPEGAVTAPVGATYNRTDGALGTSFYVKVSGTGNTGWRSLLPGSVVTATADDVTPTVLSTVVLVLGDNTVATAITQLDGGGAGQEVTLICTATANTPTIADSGNFTLSAAWAPNAGDTISLVTTNGTLWYEKSRSSN